MISDGYKRNRFGDISIRYPDVNSISNLSSADGAKVAWSHYKTSLPDSIELRQEKLRMIIAMAEYVADKSGTRENCSSMVQLQGLARDNLGEKELALELMKRAIDLDSKNIDALGSMGALLIRAKKFNEARLFLAKAIVIGTEMLNMRDEARFKIMRFLGNAVRNYSITIKEAGDLESGIMFTYMAENLWLGSEEGGWSTQTHRIALLKMRTSWKGK